LREIELLKRFINYHTS